MIAAFVAHLGNKKLVDMHIKLDAYYARAAAIGCSKDKADAVLTDARQQAPGSPDKAITIASRKLVE